MIDDILTVAWKEWKELFLQRGTVRGGTLGLLFFIGVFGIFLPWQVGPVWVESPLVLLYWAWVPLFLVTSVIADSFAGERDRHTLEMLLASRLPDRAILLGKIAAAVGYGSGITLVSLLLGVLTVNVAFGRGELLLYPLTLFVSIIAVDLLTATLAACVGVIVSLRASTVREAQQTLSIAIMLLLFVPLFGGQALPDEWKSSLLSFLSTSDPSLILLFAVAVLVIADLTLLWFAMARFRRARLMLD